MRSVVTVLFVLFLLSCSSTGPRTPHTREADEAYQAGDFERAYELYSARYKLRQDPLLREKMDLAWARAHGSRVVDPGEAGRQIREAKTMIDRGNRMMVAGRYEEALRAYRTAHEYVPGVPEARQGEVSAEKAISSRAIAAARVLEAKGEVGAAMAVLEAARAAIGDPFDAETDPLSIEDIGLRSRVGIEIMDRAVIEGSRGRTSSALLLAAAWEDVMRLPLDGSDFVWHEGMLEQFAEKNARKVYVGEVKDRTEGRIDVTKFGKQVALAWLAREASDWIELTPDADLAHLTLSVTMDVLDVDASEPVTKRRLREFVVHTEAVNNPKLAKLRKTRDRLQEDVRLANAVAFDARQEFESVRGLEGDAEIHARYSRLYGHYSTASYYRHLANARTRNAKAKRRVDKMEDSLDDVLAAIERTPPVVYRETRAKATIEETTQTKTARAIASFRIAPAKESVTFVAITSGATVTEEVTDRGWPGIADAGIPEEPLLLPSDAALADAVLVDLAKRLAGEILDRARAIRRQLYREARALEKDDRGADALDRYAAFLFTARAAFPLEARVAADKIEAEWGLKLTDDGAVDISELRLK